MDTATINISGMSCGHCVAAVRKALAGVPGVTVQEVTIGSAAIVVDPAMGSLAAAQAAIEAAGYDVVSPRVLNVAASPGHDVNPDA